MLSNLCWTNWTGNWSVAAIGSFVMRTTAISTSAASERAAGDGEHYAVHHQKAEAKGQRGEERGGPTVGAKVPGVHLYGNREPKRRIAPKALARFKERVRELTRRTRGISLQRMVEQLARYLRRLARLSSASARRPRCLPSWTRGSDGVCASVVWKQWKRGKRRFAELRARGVGKDLAAQTAGSPHGPWRISPQPRAMFRTAKCLLRSRLAYPPW